MEFITKTLIEKGWSGDKKYCATAVDGKKYLLRITPHDSGKNLVKSYLGKTVTIKIDRPIGYVHSKENYSLTYPINYGYIPEVIGGDGEELDVYLLGVNEPVSEYTAKVIGIAHRYNDVEDKLIAVPQGMVFTKEEIENAVRFQEQYYETEIEVLK